MEQHELDSFEDTVQGTSEVTNQWYKNKIRISIVRWILTVILYVWLWNKWWWVKWTLIPLMPLILFNLYHLTIGRKKLMAKLGEIQSTIDKIQSFEEE
ncbi:MAG: hypothetical protein AAF502_10860 [Bacteroidota bacterium]